MPSGQTHRAGMLIKGHERLDAELKRRKLFFSTGGALEFTVRYITIGGLPRAQNFTLAVDGFSGESSLQHTPSSVRPACHCQVHHLRTDPHLYRSVNAARAFD